ncbi:hypothetical protein GCM10023187_40180 [Nibrella viscosa]|uniref:OmpA-like domain-containing protein n=2 Tax=Nibrella viscosa TaxID=1084524 RepID=A0ABP8KR60_9BACT
MTLDSISAFLVSQPDKVIRVTGYTDTIGKRDQNLALSEFRARTVVNYLQQKGVKPGQINITRKGPDSPVSPNGSEEDKVKNRRVVIEINAN